ncbi:MAG TPA: endonuclease/exonuclease/phosphatase family protein [Bacillota bacterium]|nr:endonuclease/exonuclease/phosphatase family protein [Bacillota bacterium]
MEIRLTILSLNLHAGVNWLGRFDPQGIIELIRDVNPDLCGLQEVDSHWSKRSNFQDLPRILATNLMMDAAFFPALTTGYRAYGNLVLSKYPIINRWSQLLPDQSEQRSVGCVKLWVAGAKLFFSTTHLGLSEWDRWQQVNLIRQFLGQCNGPLILTGDFNADYQSEAVLLLSAGLQDIQKLSRFGPQGTFRARDGQVGPRIDYILASPEFIVEDFQVIDSWVSDHLPVVAKLRLEQEHLERLGGPVFYQPVQL